MKSVTAKSARLIVLLVLSLSACTEWRVEWMFQSAVGFLSEGQYDKARTSLYRVATDFPDSPRAPEALFLRADLLQTQLHNDDFAELAYKEIMQRYPEDDFGRRSIARLIEMYSRENGNTKQALRLVEFYLKKYPQDKERARMYRIMAHLFTTEGHFQQAGFELRKALKGSTNKADRRILTASLAEVAFYAGWLSETITLANSMLPESGEIDTLATEALYLKALALEEMGELDAALRQMFDLQDHYPNPRVVAEKIVVLQDRIKRRK